MVTPADVAVAGGARLAESATPGNRRRRRTRCVRRGLPPVPEPRRSETVTWRVACYQPGHRDRRRRLPGRGYRRLARAPAQSGRPADGGGGIRVAFLPAVVAPGNRAVDMELPDQLARASILGLACRGLPVGAVPVSARVDRGGARLDSLGLGTDADSAHRRPPAVLPQLPAQRPAPER